MRWIFGILVALMPGVVSAACTGTDLRAGLSDAERAEVAATVAATPYPTGNIWRATRGDQTLHLIGTLHIADARLDAIAARLAPVVGEADLLLVEADAQAQAQLESAIANDPTLVFLSGPTLLDRMSDREWRDIASAANARGIPAFMAAKFQPWYLSLILSMAPCVLQSMQTGAEGLDAALEDAAVAAGTPVRALEPYDTVFRLFNEDPMDEQLDMLRLGGIPVDAANDAHVTLVAQYLDGALAEALATSRVVGRRHVDLPPSDYDALFDETMTRILDQRNVAWMAPIAQADATRIVIAVGALHLIGERGLLNLLVQEGYTLERLPL
ncbi:TraB/GumN family protein [Sulfitobacter albidus]|uniref:TraB/GumN family protein n=1 Tax=Sulfitobacter albidus TaxID=2829501 RepID=A0A975JCG1_9RHOB|nr:TraB/GumN family protein [Sulfitobacter albidus]QUJ75525.1 TraB/GumN family protein [Sulfitobacter albidus]